MNYSDKIRIIKADMHYVWAAIRIKILLVNVREEKQSTDQGLSTSILLKQVSNTGM